MCVFAPRFPRPAKTAEPVQREERERTLVAASACVNNVLELTAVDMIRVCAVGDDPPPPPRVSLLSGLKGPRLHRPVNQDLGSHHTEEQQRARGSRGIMNTDEVDRD